MGKYITCYKATKPPCDFDCKHREHCKKTNDRCKSFSMWVYNGLIDKSIKRKPIGKPSKRIEELIKLDPQLCEMRKEVKGWLRKMDHDQLKALGCVVGMKLSSLIYMRSPGNQLNHSFIKRMYTEIASDFLDLHGIS